MDKFIIKKPVITEKANASNEKGKYIFLVDRKANKIEIKKAVEKMYGVTVESVNVMNYQGKPKSRYTSAKIISGKTANFKKAVVTVPEGEFIDLYSNI